MLAKSEKKSPVPQVMVQKGDPESGWPNVKAWREGLGRPIASSAFITSCLSYKMGKGANMHFLPQEPGLLWVGLMQACAYYLYGKKIYFF